MIIGNITQYFKKGDSEYIKITEDHSFVGTIRRKTTVRQEFGKYSIDFEETLNKPFSEDCGNPIEPQDFEDIKSKVVSYF